MKKLSPRANVTRANVRRIGGVWLLRQGANILTSDLKCLLSCRQQYQVHHTRWHTIEAQWQPTVKFNSVITLWRCSTTIVTVWSWNPNPCNELYDGMVVQCRRTTQTQWLSIFFSVVKTSFYFSFFNSAVQTTIRWASRTIVTKQWQPPDSGGAEQQQQQCLPVSNSGQYPIPQISVPIDLRLRARPSYRYSHNPSKSKLIWGLPSFQVD